MRVVLPIILLLCAACSRPTGVALRVTGLGAVAGFRSLSVEVQRSTEKAQRFSFPRETLQLEAGEDAAVLGLALDPPDARGRIKVTVSAVPDGAFVLGQGTQEAELLAGRVEIAVALESQSLRSQSGWLWESPLPSGRQLNSIWGQTPDDIWAAGVFGTLLHYNGEVWSRQELPLEVGEMDLLALGGTDRDDVWLAAGNNPDGSFPRPLLLHFDGNAWSVVGRDGSWRSLQGIAPVRRGEVWVAGWLQLVKDMLPGADSFVLRCSAAAGCGADRTVLSTVLPTPPRELISVRGIWSAGGEAPLWAIAGWRDAPKQDKTVLLRRGADGWKVDKQIDTPNVQPDRIWGIGEEVWFQYGRTTWRRDPGTGAIVADEQPFPLWQDSRKTRWGLDPRGGVQRRYTLQGGSFTPEPIPGGLTAIHGFEPNDVWVAGTRGQLRHYDGTSWSARGTLWITDDVKPPLSLNGMASLSASDVLAVGTGGRALHFDGQAWSPEQSGTTQDLQGVFALGGDYYAVGRAGTLLRRHQGTWQAEQSADASAADLFDIWGAEPGELWAVGDHGTILRRGMQDGRWTVARSTGPRLLSIWGAASTRWAVGCSVEANIVPAAVRLRGGAWEDVPAELPLDVGRCYERVWFNDDKTIWAMHGGDSFRPFDVASDKWGAPARGFYALGRCVEYGAGELWCPQVQGVVWGKPGLSTTTFRMGGESGYGYRHLYRVGDHFFSYGFGVLRCTRGRDCAIPER